MKDLLSIILPTYNEVENIVPLVKEIITVLKKKKWPFEIIIVDDNSPDGTALDIKKKLKDERVKLFIRLKDNGLAKSVREGIERASGELLLIMDADFNHDPIYIPRMLEVLPGYDLVIGSRYIKGGGMPFSKKRYLISLFSNLFLKMVLAFPYRDALSGFLLFRRKVLNGINKGKIFRGYGDYSIRFLYWTKLKGVKAKEVPVIYKKRRGGKTKTRLLKVMIQYLITTFDCLK